MKWKPTESLCLSDFMTTATFIWQLSWQDNIDSYQKKASSQDNMQTQKYNIRLLWKAVLPPLTDQYLSNHFLEQHFYIVQLHSLHYVYYSSDSNGEVGCYMKDPSSHLLITIFIYFFLPPTIQ